MKVLKNEFIVPLYDVRVVMYMGGSMKDNVEYINKDYNISLDNDKCQAKSLRFSNDKETTFAMLFTEHENLPQMIAHESLHVSWYICEYLGIKLSTVNHEAQAYILEYIVSKANSFIV